MYAVISVGGKQYRVAEGQTLLVDRLRQEVGATFTPELLFVADNGDVELAPEGVTVTARVVDHVLGHKLRIGKYKPKSGYRRHAGHRSKLSRIEIQAIGRKKAARATRPKKEAEASAADAEGASVKTPPVKRKARATNKAES